MTPATLEAGTPSAFASMNQYVFGSPPPNNSANPGDAPTIYYVSYQPTVLHEGTKVNVAVITSTNTQRVAIGPPGFTVNASQVGAGKWIASYSFSARGYAAGQTSLTVPIVAYRMDGISATVNVPINITP